MVNHPPLIRAALCDMVCSRLNAGHLVMLSATGVEIARLTFSAQAFSAAVDGVAHANEISSDINAIGGKIAKASLRDGDDNEVLRCDVTEIGGGGDILMSTLTIATGQEVSLSALTYVGVQ